jgi:2-polyprenyl-3-methyl-5-hydroxy-6-metoxy-1,4-benzoquinol methylase
VHDAGGEPEVERLEVAQVRETFDVVTAWHVIERVLDPLAFVSDLARVTRDGGLVLLDTPVSGGIAQASVHAKRARR